MFEFFVGEGEHSGIA